MSAAAAALCPNVNECAEGLPTDLSFDCMNASNVAIVSKILGFWWLCEFG